MARLSKGAEVLISMAFLVMCAEKILRLLRLFFITVYALFYAWQGPGTLWEEIRNIWNLEMLDTLVAVYICVSAAYPPLVGCIWTEPAVHIFRSL